MTILLANMNIIRTRKFSIIKVSELSIFIPWVAGRINPIYSNGLGSISAGNMIPESIIEGRNTSCEYTVSLAEFFANKPNIIPISRVAVKKSRKPDRYIIVLSGSVALKARGDTVWIMALTAVKLRKPETMLELTRAPNGIPADLNDFLISFPK